MSVVDHRSAGELQAGLAYILNSPKERGFRKTADGSAHPDMQINLMNTRVISLVAGDRQYWPLAGDQFFVDMDLSDENLPPDTRLRPGTARLEITAEPHLGCKKFTARFGLDAMKFVNSGLGKERNQMGARIRFRHLCTRAATLRQIPSGAWVTSY